MELTPEEKQRIYAEEKARIEAREQIEAEIRQNKAQVATPLIAPSPAPVNQTNPQVVSKRPSALGPIAVVVIIVIVVIVLKAMSSSPSTSDNSTPQAPAASSTQDLDSAAQLTNVGDVGALYTGDPDIYVADTEDDYNKYINAIADKDDQTRLSLIDSKSVYPVGSGTAAKLLASDQGDANVQIAAGDHNGENVWTNAEYLKQQQ
jgi:hypothetical protein